MSGRQPLAYISDKSRAALDNRVIRIASDIPSLAVSAISDRLMLNGFDSDRDPWSLYLANDMDQLAPILHKEAMALGQAFALVWAGPDGRPRVTIESAEQCAVRRNVITREVEIGVKRVRDEKQSHAWLYYRDRIEYWRADTNNAAAGSFSLVETIPNVLGVVPLIPFTNTDRLLDVDGRSEIEPLKPLVDGLNATLAGLAVAVEAVSLPRRWAVGLQLKEEPVTDENGDPVTNDDGEPVNRLVSPISDSDRLAISEDEGTKFGNWDAADLTGYRTAVDIWLSQIEAVSSIPASMLGVLQSLPPTAEALRAASTALTNKASGKQLAFGRSHEQVARLLVALRDGIDPADVQVRASWGDPASNTTSAEADALSKLYSVHLLSRRTCLARMGMTQDEIETETANLYAELDEKDDFVRYLATGSSGPRTTPKS